MIFVLFLDVCFVVWVVNCEFCGFCLIKIEINLNKKCWFDFCVVCDCCVCKLIFLWKFC